MIGLKRSAFDMRNQVKIDSTVVTVEGVNQKIDEFDNHVSGSNPNAHIIGSIGGLQAILDGKAEVDHTHELDDITDLNGYTGTLNVITEVDFTAETVSTSTLTFVNGLLTEIV